jgi:hypothetical protein
MRGLDPRIHPFSEEDGLPGHRRAEATPSFGTAMPGNDELNAAIQPLIVTSRS